MHFRPKHEAARVVLVGGLAAVIGLLGITPAAWSVSTNGTAVVPYGDPLVVLDATGDTSGGTDSAADLTTMQHPNSAYWFSVFTATFSDPTTDPAWTQYGSTVRWDVDVNKDGVVDEVITFHGGPVPSGDVRRASDGALICASTKDSSVSVDWGVKRFGTLNTGTGYGVYVSPWCLPSSLEIGIRATITYHASPTTTQTDSVPDTGLAKGSNYDWNSAAHPVLVSGAQWYNASARTRDADNYFGIPSDIAVNTFGGIIFPAGPSTAFFATRKVVMRPGASGGPTFFRQFRSGLPFQAANNEYVTSFHWGNVGDIPVSGDWNGDGFDTLGLFRPSTGQWFLTDDPYFANSPGAPLTVLSFASPGDIPVTGDWTGTGTETPGVFRQGRWYFVTSLHSGAADMSTLFGNPGDAPVPGYWTGATPTNHTTTVAVWRAGTWYLADTNSSPTAVGFDSGGSPGDQFLRPTPIY